MSGALLVPSSLRTIDFAASSCTKAGAKNVGRGRTAKCSRKSESAGKHRVACSAGSKSHAKVADNPVGLHAMVWVGGWSNEECEKAISSTAKLGYDMIEVPVFSPEAMDTAFTRSQLELHGLQASTSLGLTAATDISSSDADVSSRGVQKLLSALQAADAIGAKYLVGVTHSAIAKYPLPFDKAGPGRQNLVKGLRTVATQAADKGIVFGVEVVNRYESNVLNTAQQAVELLEEVDHPNIIVHLDSYHMNIEEGSLADAVAVCGDKLGYVHIGESHRGYLGSGTVDFTQLFRALARAQYSGPLTFESFSSTVVSPDLSNTLAVWRNLWDDSNDLAKEAKSFIDSQWSSALKAV